MYLEGRGKPRAWMDAALKAAKAFSAEARAEAAAAAQVRVNSGTVSLHQLHADCCLNVACQLVTAC